MEIPIPIITEADVAQAMSEVPLDGWPQDDDELIALFMQIAQVLIEGAFLREAVSTAIH